MIKAEILHLRLSIPHYQTLRPNRIMLASRRTTTWLPLKNQSNNQRRHMKKKRLIHFQASTLMTTFQSAISFLLLVS